jgi:hypothetical protein
MSGMGGLNFSSWLRKERAKKQNAIANRALAIENHLRPRIFLPSLSASSFGEYQILRHILLFGNPLRAFSTKEHCESVFWPRVIHSGMVIMERIGQSAYLLPNDDLLVYGRVSETERIWVGDEGLSNQSRLKIQSSPFGNLWESERLQ